ncbi:hypothetical protein VPH35_071069 [Triticum aestivum]
MELTSHALILPLLLAALLHPVVVAVAVAVAVDDGIPGGSGCFSLRLVPSPSWNSTIHVNSDGFLHLNEPVVHVANVLRPHVHPFQGRYTIATNIGMGHDRRTYTLAMEMTSSLTWMQCVTIQHPFQQVPPPFNPATSSSFHPVAPSNHICSSPGHNVCRFHTTPTRPGGSQACGVLGIETLSFTAFGHGAILAVIPAVIVGCAHTTASFKSHGVVAGIFGLGKTYPTACIASPIASSCPGRQTNTASSGLATTSSSYFVNLIGISVAETRLGGNLAEAFRRRQLDDGRWHSGCMIDSGTPWGVMVKVAYDILEHALAEHGRRIGVTRVPRTNFGLCFCVTRAILSRLPTVTLHLVLSPKKLFISQGQDICLTVSPNSHITIIGAIQQLDTHFVYDLAASRVYFAPENCNTDTDGQG